MNFRYPSAEERSRVRSIAVHGLMGTLNVSSVSSAVLLTNADPDPDAVKDACELQRVHCPATIRFPVPTRDNPGGEHEEVAALSTFGKDAPTYGRRDNDCGLLLTAKAAPSRGGGCSPDPIQRLRDGLGGASRQDQHPSSGSERDRGAYPFTPERDSAQTAGHHSSAGARTMREPHQFSSGDRLAIHQPRSIEPHACRGQGRARDRVNGPAVTRFNCATVCCCRELGTAASGQRTAACGVGKRRARPTNFTNPPANACPAIVVQRTAEGVDQSASRLAARRSAAGALASRAPHDSRTRWRNPIPEGEPVECDGTCWDRLPPAVRARVA